MIALDISINVILLILITLVIRGIYPYTIEKTSWPRGSDKLY